MSTQTVKFKGEFDVSSILNSIKQMRAELAKSGNSSLFGNLDKEIEKLEGLGSTIQAQIGKGFASSKEFKTFESNISKLELEIQKIGKGFNEVSSDNLAAQLKKIDEQTAEIANKAKKAAEEFRKAFNADMGGVGKNAKDMNKQVTLMAEQGKSYAETEKKIISLYDEKIQKAKELAAIEKQAIQNQKNNQAVSTAGLSKDAFYKSNGQGKRSSALTDTQFEDIRKIWEESVKNFPSAGKALDNFRKKLKELNIVRKDSNAVNNAFKASFSEYQNALTAGNSALKAHETALKNAEKTENELIAEKSRYVASLKSEEAAYNETVGIVNAAAAAEANAAALKQQATNASNQESAAINALNGSLATETANLRASADATRDSVKSSDSLNMSLDSMKSRIAYIFSLGNAFYQVKRAIQDTLNDAKNIDKAFASIAMVTDKTVSGLWEHYGEYAEMAQKLGQSTESAIKASALFYQQGLKDAEVMELTEETMKLATLAGLDFEQATSQMTAALRGFHMEMDQGAHVTDVYSELAAHAAADVNGIAYAMSKTASIANNAGMSFENTAAMLTQMIETTQEAPENIGTAMKTIIARFTELKKNVAGTADSEFEDLDYNKVDTALKSVGVSLKDVTGQFRNLDDVFMELSAKWDTLDRNSQRYIATIAAGSRQQSRFIAMMEDYDRTMQLVNITKEAEGRADEQFAKNAESLTFKLQSLATAWEQFRMKLADVSIFKTVIDGLTSFVDTLNELSESPAKLVTFVATFAIVGKMAATRMFKAFKDGIKAFSGEGKTLISQWLSKLSPSGRMRIKLEADIKNSEKEIKRLESEIEGIGNKKIQIKADITDFEKKKQALEAEMRELQAYVDAGRATPNQIATLEQKKNEHMQIEQEIRKQNANLAQQEQLEVNNRRQLEAQNQDLEKMTQKYNKKTFGEKYGRDLGMSVGIAFSTAISSAMASNDPLEVWSTGVKTTLAIIVPQFLSAIFTVQTAAEAAEAAVSFGLSLLVSGVVSGLVALGVAIKNKLGDTETSAQKAIRIAAEAKKANDEIADNADSTKQQAKDELEAVENARALKDEYTKLAEKVVKTEEETEKQKELAEQINEEFPDMVSYYNDITGELTLQNDLWDELLEKQEQSAKELEKQGKLMSMAASMATFGQQVENEATQMNQKHGFDYADYRDAMYSYVGGDTSAFDKFAESLEADAETVKQLSDGLREYSDVYESTTMGTIKYSSLKEAQANGTMDTDMAYYRNALELGSGGIQLHIGKDIIQGKNGEYYNSRSSNFIEILQRAADNSANSAQLQDIIARYMEHPDRNDTLFTEEEFKLITQALDDYSEILEQNGKDAIEASKKQTEEMVKALNAKLTSEFSELYKKEHEGASEGEILLAGAIQAAATSEDAQKLTAFQEAVLKQDAGRNDANKHVALGGDDDDNISSYKGKTNIIHEANGVQFSEAQIYNYLSKAFSGDIAAAQKFWNEELGTEISRATWVYQQILTEQAENALTAKKYFMDNPQLMADYEAKLAAAKEGNLQVIQELSDFLEANGFDTAAINNVLGQYKELREKIETELAQIGISDAIIKEAKTSNLSTLSSLISGYVEQGFREADVNGFFADLANQYGKIDENLISAVQSVDLSSITLANYEENKDKFIDSLKSTMGEAFNEGYANRLWEDFFKQAENHNLVNIKLTTEQAIDDFKNSFQEGLDTIVDSSKKAATAVEAQLTNGSITFSEYRDLAEELAKLDLNVDDYVKTEGDQMVLDAKALEAAYDAQLNDEEKLLETAKAKLRAGIEQLQQEADILLGMKAQNKWSIDNYNVLIQQVSASEALARNILTMTGNMEALNHLESSESFTFMPDQKEIDEQYDAIVKRINELTDLYNDDEELKKRLGFSALNAAASETKKNFKDAHDNAQEALDKTKKSVEDLTDKVKALNEALYGKADHDNKLDALYNYATALDRITNSASKTKEALEDLNNAGDAEELVNKYANEMSQAASVRLAENEVLQRGIENYQQVLAEDLGKTLQSLNTGDRHISTNVSDYYSFDEATGAWLVNFEALNAAQIPDDFSDYVENSIDQLNKWQKQIEDNVDANEKALKEVQQMQKNALGKIVALEDTVKNVLKDKYNEEVNDLKDKYKSMEDANDEYLDALEEAIKKERDLRDTEDAWEELAKKEKQLSLMQRDTSGLYAKDTLSLENEIEDDRQKLLDETVDNMLETMKEMYEDQKEANEQKIEALNELVDEGALTREAVQIISTWQSTDDMIAWMFENNTNIEDMSEAKLEQEMMNWSDTFNAAQSAQVIRDSELDQRIQATEQGIEYALNTYSERVSTQATTDLENTRLKVVEAIEKAEADLAKAIEENNKNSTGNGTTSNTPKGTYTLTYKNGDDIAGTKIVSAADYEAGKYDKTYTYYKGNTSYSATVASAVYDENGVIPGSKIAPYTPNKTTIPSTTTDNKLSWGTGSGSGGYWGPPELSGDYNGDGVVNIADSVLQMQRKANRYATGGLVPYTGIAQVDGTPSRPEAFLSAEDTERFLTAAQLFAMSPLLNSASAQNAVSSSIGDTSIEININVESISDDYDVDRLVKRVEEDIAEAAQPTGTAVILNKRV